jgi:hypothetical protein
VSAARKTSTTPTQRTLARLRKDGALAGIVERWNQHARVRQDLFGFIDIVAIRDGAIVAVQCTSTPNMASRCTKIADECTEPAREWLRAGGAIEVWGWAKRGPAGKRKLWTVRIVPILINAAGKLYQGEAR